MGHYGQVVGDVDGGGLELPGDVFDGGQDFDLGGHIERRGGLIEDNDVGPAGHGHGHHGPLQLSARNLVGIAVADVLRVGQQQAPVEFHGLFFSFGKAHQPVLDRRLGILFDQPVGRVEGGGGTLGHVGDSITPDFPQLSAGERG